MDVSDEKLSDAVDLLRKLSDACAELDHLAGWQAHRSLVQAQGYLASIAVELGEHGDLQAAIAAALDKTSLDEVLAR